MWTEESDGINFRPRYFRAVAPEAEKHSDTEVTPRSRSGLMTKPLADRDLSSKKL